MLNIWALMGINICLWLILISNADIKFNGEKSNKPIYKGLFTGAIIIGTLLIQCLF